MSYGMFCAIPQPVHLWDETCVNLVLPCFPLIGGIIGALWWGFAEIMIFSGIHITLAAAAAAVFPFLVTGFLHLEGYMDTSDAVLSRRPIEDKLRILKDPHTGAFAVIMIAVLFILWYAAVSVVIESGKYLVLLVIIPIVSRCCSALSILCLKTLAQSSYANMFRKNSGTAHKVFIIIIAVFSITLAFFIAGFYGLVVSALVITGFIAAMAWAYNDLKGVSGDLAGFALVIGELCGLAAMAVIV